MRCIQDNYLFSGEKDMLDLGIIIPVYKVEKYLKECIDSLIDSIIDGVQVILIDDGSPDNCGNICDSYSRKYPFITTIHTDNHGVSEARNTGLNNIDTKYVTFIDSDDIVSKTYFQEIDRCIRKYDVELYHFKHANFYKLEEPEKDYDGITMGIKNNNKELFLAAFERRLCFVWDKVYLNRVIQDNHIRFPKGIKTSEDLLFNAEYLRHIRTAYVSDKNIYFHRSNQEGVAFNPKLSHFYDISNVYSHMDKIITDEGFGKKEKCSQDKAYLRFIGLYMIYPLLNECASCDISEALKASGLQKVIKGFTTNSIESILLKYCIKNRCYSIIKIYFPIQMWLRNTYHKIRGSKRI